MEEKQKIEKQPMHRETIYKLMLILTYGVSALFLIKNVIGMHIQGMLVICASLVVLTGILFAMKLMKTKASVKQFAVSVALMFVVFIISTGSGESYSDDFIMYLAVIALAGMYLRPKYTMIQVILGEILLGILYAISPAKGGEFGQYVLCMAVFALAGSLIYMDIRRGRSFITRSELRTAETEELLTTITEMGATLQKDAENSLSKVDALQKSNSDFEGNVDALRTCSDGVARSAEDMTQTCENVQTKIQATEQQIDALNEEVRGFEASLAENRANMTEMTNQMEVVKSTMQEANEVFCALEQQMLEICKVTEQLNSISESTTMLALNASIEAARAGHMGAGFAVVASKVQDLAVDSNKCSEEVAKVVAKMQKQIQQTTEQMDGSANAIDNSIGSLGGLQDSFTDLTKQFTSLYKNIEEQNHNIAEVNEIFEQLKDMVAGMSSYSEENQASVDSITQSMLSYRENVKAVISDTRHVHALSVDMMNYSREQTADIKDEE